MNIFIVGIEPINTRYTGQWYSHIPILLSSHMDSESRVYIIDGEEVPANVPEGLFLDFAATNIYKSSQMVKLAKYFQSQTVQDGDHIIFTDAWNTSILQCKYMKDLLGIDVTLHGLWHAGAYDPSDALGQLIPDKKWSSNTEMALYHSLDCNWFATQFHKDMFSTNVFDNSISDSEFNSKALLTGWPMDYMNETLETYSTIEKENIVLFPHRKASEKQPDIFADLANKMPEYEFIFCQDKELTKDEYHTLLGRAKMVFSANLQETLGITTCNEGPLSMCIPFAPDRLSYTEIFKGYDAFLYPSNMTEDYESYLLNDIHVVSRMRHLLDNYDIYTDLIRDFNSKQMPKFFSADALIARLFDK